MDIPKELNKINNAAISIKTTGRPNTICMADVIRLYNITSSHEPFHLIVLIYDQIDDYKKIKNVVEINMTGSHELLFGHVKLDELKSLDSAVKAIPQKRSPTKEEHTELYKMKAELQQFMYIQLNIKCNSQQSRLQCSFNRFSDFLSMYPERIIEKSAGNIFRGIELIDIRSCKRSFASKE